MRVISKRALGGGEESIALHRITGGWLGTAPTITQLIHETIRAHLDCPNPDVVLNIETHLFNVTLQSATCQYDLDVGKNLWLNKQRWSRLIKEYFPREPWLRFLAQTQEILDGGARLGATANMMFRDPDRYEKKHRWGGCLMGATFRGDNKKSGPATLTFHTRTTYMGYMGLLDAGIAAVMASCITDPIIFRWHITSMQLHCFKTLPYVYSQPDLMAKLEAITPKTVDMLSPTWRYLGKWYLKVLEHWKLYGPNPEAFLAKEKYGPFKRIKRRWCEYKGYLKKNVPSSLNINSLDFEKAI